MKPTDPEAAFQNLTLRQAQGPSPRPLYFDEAQYRPLNFQEKGRAKEEVVF
jgi:hypothetical protein